MAILKKGDSGPAVKELQKMLQELDYAVNLSSIYDAATVKAVLNFQSSHLDKHGRPLELDGKVGDLTMWALQNPRPKAAAPTIDFTKMPAAGMGGHPVGRKALQTAIDELSAGAGEIGGNNKGKFVKKYLQPAGLGEGESWCAAFISWCFMQASGGNKEDMPFRYTAGARNIFNQYKSKGWNFGGTGDTTLPEPGDIVAWWRISMPSGLGHIGLVHHFEDGFIYSIEGNKSSRVAGFTYVKTRLDKFLGFGRVQ